MPSALGGYHAFVPHVLICADEAGEVPIQSIVTMGFSLGISTPRNHPHYHHPLLQPNSPTFYPPRPPTLRRNASKRSSTIAAFHHHQRGGGEKEVPDVSRRTLLVLALAGSSLLRLGEAVLAEDLIADAEDAYQEVTFDRRRLQRKIRKESLAADGKDSSVIKGNDFDKIKEEILPSPQNSVEIKQKPSSPPQNVSDLKQEMPSSTQNETQGLPQEEVSMNSSFSIMNSVGILGSGVLGALYAISLKDKEALQSTVDSMKSLLEEKDAAKRSLEKSFKEEMATEKEKHRKEISTFQEGEVATAKQLASVNNKVSDLGKELTSEKNSVKELSLQLDRLRASLQQTGDEKRKLDVTLKEKMDEIGKLQDRVSLLGFNVKEKDKGIEELNISLVKKTAECDKLNSTLDEAKTDYRNLCSSLDKLKEEATQTRKELTLKNAKIDELTRELKSVMAERDKANKSTATLQVEYEKLKMASSKKAEMDSELLSQKADQLEQLKGKLDLALKEMQDKEVSMSKAQAVCNKLSSELATAKKDSDTAAKKLAKVTNELKASSDACESLKAEVLEANKKAKASSREMQKEQEVAANLHKELELTRKQIAELLEARKALENSLGKVSESLDKANSKSLLLSEELENAKSRNGVLEKEAEELQTLLIEQRNTAKVAREKMEGAQNAIFDLGAQRDSLLKKNEKLEEELASAKGEILWLRQQPDPRGASPGEDNNDTNKVEASVASERTKRTVGRRKGKASQ